MARLFNGGTDRLAYTTISGSIGTVAFWMKTTQTTTNALPVSAWTSSSKSGFGFLMNNPANKIAAIGADATAQRVGITSTSSINTGAWFHIAFNFNCANGGGNSLYINGVSEASANSSAVWSIGGATVVNLGDNNDAFWPSPVADLAEMGIWVGRQLTSDELVSLAKGATPDQVGIAVLERYIPLVSATGDRLFGPPSTTVGGAASVHPRIFA